MPYGRQVGRGGHIFFCRPIVVMSLSSVRCDCGEAPLRTSRYTSASVIAAFWSSSSSLASGSVGGIDGVAEVSPGLVSAGLGVVMLGDAGPDRWTIVAELPPLC